MNTGFLFSFVVITEKCFVSQIINLFISLKKKMTRWFPWKMICKVSCGLLYMRTIATNICASHKCDTHRQKVCHSADNVNNYLVDNNRCVRPMQIDVCEHIRTRYRSINYNYLCCRCPGNITFLAVSV